MGEQPEQSTLRGVQGAPSAGAFRAKREALRRLRREAQMTRAYAEREDEALLAAREAGATMRELAAAHGALTTGGVRHRLEGLRYR